MIQFLRVAFYARVSSQRQADEKTIQSQRQDLVSRIERDQVRMDPEFEYCDDGYTGSVLLRPALEKLRDNPATIAHAPAATAHLWIESPLDKQSKGAHGWFNRLFETHPPIETRIAALQEAAGSSPHLVGTALPGELPA